MKRHPTHEWWALSSDIFSANLAAQRAIALRLMKIAKGGAAAQREADKMVSEKMTAGIEAAAKLAMGGSLGSVVRHYRTIVRANEKRLSTVRLKRHRG